MSSKQRSGAKVSVPTLPNNSSSPPSTPNLAEHPDPGTTLEGSVVFRNLDAQQCSQKRCSGNGRCVEDKGDISCVCSLGYSGDSCQDHFFKTMQGPIVYGAAGICAGLVVIVVMAVVVGRRKSANTRFVFPFF